MLNNKPGRKAQFVVDLTLVSNMLVMKVAVKIWGGDSRLDLWFFRVYGEWG